MKKAFLQLHAAVFLWGFTGVLGRAINLNPVLLVWYRLLITVVTLWIGYAILKKLKRLPLRPCVYIGFVGTILSLHWVCFLRQHQILQRHHCAYLPFHNRLAFRPHRTGAA
jgi:drug/metabolite transporter (DMT)-like permease